MFLTTNAPRDLDVRLDQMEVGLTEAQAEMIKRGLGARYLVDRHGVCDGGLALMIIDNQAKETDTVLYVDVEPVGLCLSCLEDEVLHHVGCYTSVDGLLAAIHSRG
jgi:hypothetical protein